MSVSLNSYLCPYSYIYIYLSVLGAVGGGCGERESE